ncbi:Uncharacterised protein [Mycobacteroides abscessus subsp. abscessus]|nr:Uncharacterised protein [Mycobacteroides abscessus subsp. abscessus]
MLLLIQLLRRIVLLVLRLLLLLRLLALLRLLWRILLRCLVIRIRLTGPLSVGSRGLVVRYLRPMSGLLRLLGLLPGLLTWNLLGRLRTTAVVYRDAIVLIQRRLVVATLVIRHRAGHLRWLELRAVHTPRAHPPARGPRWVRGYGRDGRKATTRKGVVIDNLRSADSHGDNRSQRRCPPQTRRHRPTILHDHGYNRPFQLTLTAPLDRSLHTNSCHVDKTPAIKFAIPLWPYIALVDATCRPRTSAAILEQPQA